MKFDEAWAYKWTTNHDVRGETVNEEIRGMPALVFEDYKDRDIAIKLLNDPQGSSEAIEILRTLIKEVLDYNETPPMCRICRYDKEHEPSWCARKQAMSAAARLSSETK